MMVKKAMLGKWPWRLIYGGTGLCRSILCAKYNVNHVFVFYASERWLSVGWWVDECLSFRRRCR